MNLLKNKAPPILRNPFFHRGPIRNRRYFFGRTEETRRALQMLRHGQCVSVVGPRRIGETSLLFHLCDPEVQKRHGLGEEDFFVYIDCQGLGDLDKQQFYQWLWEEVEGALVRRGKTDGWAESISDGRIYELGEKPETEPFHRFLAMFWHVFRRKTAEKMPERDDAAMLPQDSYTSISNFKGFRQAMMTIQEKGYKPTFLFDEFEVAAKNPNLDKDFFSDLRSLVPGVVYVTASQDSLYNLTYADKSVLGSPFFNVFPEIQLGFLRPEEAEEMVSELLRMTKQENFFTEKDLAFVFEAGGYYPFFLQLACYHLFEQKMERQELVEADYESVRQHYAEQVEPHFRYAWKNLKANEQKVVQLVYEGKISQLDDEQKRRLERKCILYNDAFFSSVFAEFVPRQMTRAKAQEAHKVRRRKALHWFKRVVVTLVVILFVLSAILVWPDFPDLTMRVLNIENVTFMNLQSTGGKVQVKVYSPKLLFVGETAFIEMQTYGPEKPEFEVIVHHKSSDVVITGKKDVFEVKCKGTNANILSRSEPIKLEVKATVPTGPPDTATVTVKTNYFLSLLVRVGVLLTSGGLSVKKLWEWLRATRKGKQTPYSPKQTTQDQDVSNTD